MKNLLFALVLIYSLPAAKGQSVSSASSSGMNQIEETDSFRKLTDSLYLEQKYNEIIGLCSENSKYYLNSICLVNLMVCYYKLGDSAKHDSYLNQMLSRYWVDGRPDAASAISVLTYPNTCMSDYLGAPLKRRNLIDSILRLYNMEHVSLYDTGKILMEVLIEDQTMRTQLNFYNDSIAHLESRKREYIFTNIFKERNKENLSKQFDIYKSSRRIFNKEEIGSIYRKQFLLFAHEANATRRAYYFKLIKDAVDKGLCEKSKILDFILRTECMEKGVPEFLKTLNTRVEQLKKEYNLKEYSYSII